MPRSEERNCTAASALTMLKKELKNAGDPDRAVQEKRYLKSPFRFHGVSVPATDTIARTFKKRHPSIGRDRLLNIISLLWGSDFHDEKRLALKLMRQYPEHITYPLMPMLEAMLSASPTWDLVDEIAIHLVSIVLEKNRRAFASLKKWGRSKNFWMRRASMISQILLIRKSVEDRDLFFDLAEHMITEKEFFIRKAIGWVIRELSRSDQKAALAFLMKIRAKASGLTLREGAKRLPENMKKKLLA